MVQESHTRMKHIDFGIRNNNTVMIEVGKGPNKAGLSSVGLHWSPASLSNAIYFESTNIVKRKGHT